ncbi:serine/threonine protein kinase [Kribbella qitaiheensis]|uniref:Serine/threonine protein kinase n=1 Tax=Kribbella qitaiheensis TaxID=1544730 RepID=A0A7G6WZV0_9ACTN|nr:serine/threonine-protein kinase [Kribbella qitaiheensis]QNE19515.1 serine/threonine protein kinase [Kribbella qitaiheensis]
MSVTGGRPTAPVDVDAATVMDEQVGPYKLLRRLGQGGMGVVYLAEGPVHKEVALKVLRPHVAHDPTARARLEREATTLTKVSHPGVAGILDHDLRSDRPYLVTRFIPGRPLDEQVDDRGPLTPQRWLPLAGCLAESLQAVHQAGVIHRDLKPGNVMMFNGKPVMIDFGIAQAADDLRLTQTGLVIGTPGYLAPELIEGEMVSESADWWGWAATVAYAATGRRPFGKGPFEVVLHRVHTGKADLEGLDPRLKPLLAAALSPARGDRPTQLEIMTGLNRYAEGRDALIPDPTTAVVEKETVQVNPPTAVMTRVMPADAIAATAVAGHDPAEVAGLVPSVIPPLSAFSPLRDKLRDVAAQQKAKAATPAPVHPATYSPVPTAAAPPAMPLSYQGAPGQGIAPYQPTYPQPSYQPQYQPQTYQPQPQPSYRPEPPPYQGPQPGHGVVAKQPAGDTAAPANQQAARSVVLVALMLALSGLMALYPGFGLLVTALLLAFARTVDRGSTALMRRRQVRGGRGKSDGVIAIAASPVHLMAASLITLFCLILPVVMGFIVGGVVTAGAASSHGTDWEPLSAIGFGAGGVAGLLTAWWGPGGSSLRRGAKITVRSAFRPAWLSLLVAVLLLVLAVASFVGATNGSGSQWARGDIHLPSTSSLTDFRGYPLIRDLPIIGRN